jgi:folate-binding protein YgfZ
MVVNTGSTLDREYQALHTSAVVVDRTARGRMRFTGARAGEVLTGLLTNDVLALTAGRGLYAAALTAKGRIIADPRIIAGDGWYLADVPERAREGWNALIQKFVNPRLSKYTDESAATCDIGVFGPEAASVVGRVTGAAPDALAALPEYGHATGSLDEHTVVIVREPGAGVPGFDILGPAAARAALHAHLQQAGAIRASDDTWAVARVEAGRPEWGLDMDDSTIPQEANFDELGAISYSKGCYTGQEVVARIHFRGHVNRHLRGVRAEGQEDRLPPGATLLSDDGSEVGDVRSSVVSPRLGPIAIAMIRREVPLDGSLVARWQEGESRVRVTSLPFPA